jgi:hypothetical protein
MIIEDCDGNIVSKGSVVKILRIDPSLIKSLPEDDRNFVESMVAKEFIVDEIQNGYAVVSKEWILSDGKTHYQSISLSKNEMKLVR